MTKVMAIRRQHRPLWASLVSRWPEGYRCPRCGHTEAYKLTTRRLLQCSSCRHQTSVTAGTVMHRARVPLPLWFWAAYLVTTHTPGFSALQLQRQLGLNRYETAWTMLHKLRRAMVRPERDRIAGTVEVDETYVGGIEEGRRGGRQRDSNKSIVVGAVQRDGKIRLERIPNTRRATLDEFIERTVTDRALAIYTDAFPSYRGLGKRMNVHHDTVHHSMNEWVVGDVHTNSVEGVWSLFKRSIMGSFHQISAKHMDRYLEELEWRFNNRDNPFIFRDLLLRVLDGKALRYKSLTA